MAYEVILKKRFLNKLQQNLIYLEEVWGRTIADQLLEQLDKRIETLSEQPFIGISSEKIKGAKSFLLTKHNRVYYRIKGKQIEIINLYDTRTNPKKNPYK